jgi:hypothetical protein
MLDLVALSRPGILVLMKKDTKDLFLVFNSRNMCSTLIDVINKSKNNIVTYGDIYKDISSNNVSIIVPCFTDHIIDTERMLLKERVVSELEGFNMKPYTGKKKAPAIKYKIKYEIESLDFDYDNENGKLKYVFSVYLVSKRGSKILVGLFDYKKDMDLFLQSYYNTEDIQNIVYACNHLTSKHFSGILKTYKYIPKKDYNRISNEYLKDSLKNM